MVTYRLEQSQTPLPNQWVVIAVLGNSGLTWEVGRYSQKKKAEDLMATGSKGVGTFLCGSP